jgi:sugar lactone lactonase YvrE
VRQVANGVAFPNGMAVTPNNSTLIRAESYANKLRAVDIAADGTLSTGRVWADLGDGVPDGTCIDVDGAVWFRGRPEQMLRARQGRRRSAADDRAGPRLLRVHAGGATGNTLFMVVREWRGIESTPTKHERAERSRRRRRRPGQLAMREQVDDFRRWSQPGSNR